MTSLIESIKLSRPLESSPLLCLLSLLMDCNLLFKHYTSTIIQNIILTKDCHIEMNLLRLGLETFCWMPTNNPQKLTKPKLLLPCNRRSPTSLSPFVQVQSTKMRTKSVKRHIEATQVQTQVIGDTMGLQHVERTMLVTNPQLQKRYQMLCRRFPIPYGLWISTLCSLVTRILSWDIKNLPQNFRP